MQNAVIAKYKLWGEKAKHENMSFDELVNLWMCTTEKQLGSPEGLAYSTYYTYRCTLQKYILPFFSGEKINNIDKAALTFYRDYLRAEYELTSKTINNQMMLLRTLCTFAADRNLISVSWFNGFKNSRIVDPEITCFTSNQIRNILALIDQEVVATRSKNESSVKFSRMEEAEREKRQARRLLNVMAKQVFLNIAVYSGARRGEIMGLDWENICLDTHLPYIEFRGTAYRKKGEGSQKKATLKNGTKAKRVYITDELATILKNYRAYQAHAIQLFGCKDHGYVFISLFEGNRHVGSRGNCDSYSSWFAAWAKKNKDLIGLTEEEADKAHLHCFRHSFVTNLLSNGVDIKTVAELAGHKDCSITLKRYSHAVDANKIKAKELLSSVYSAESNK